MRSPRPCSWLRPSVASATSSTRSCSVCRPTLPWGLEIDAGNSAFPVGLPADTLFHPTFLYEMIWNVVGIVFLLTMERQYGFVKKHVLGLTVPVFAPTGPVRLQWGKVWALYLIWYGVGRVWFESIRIDPSEVFLGLRVNVWGALVDYRARRRPVRRPVAPTHRASRRAPTLPVATWNADGAVNSEDRYSEHDIVVNAVEESAPVTASK